MGLMRTFAKDESGASAALYALALPALIGMAGLGFDYARMAGMDSELQNAADQAALAGATQLDQTSGSITRAINAARGSDRLVTNETLFSNDALDAEINISAANVFFYETQANAEAGTSPIDTTATGADAKARFIRVVVDTRRANYALTPVVGAFFGDLAAEAVAGIGAALCRTPPLMICNPSEPTSNTNTNLPFNADNYQGMGLYLKGGASGGGGTWAPGNFGFLDTYPGGGGGTPELRKALGWDSVPGDCISKTANDTVDTEPGNKTDIADSINTRFDIYQDVNACPAGGKCPSSYNSQKDLIHPASLTGTKACAFNKDGWEEGAIKYLPATNAALTLSATTIPTAMGHPRDVCHATASNTCTGAGPIGDGFWDRDAYFASYYKRSDGTYWSASEWQANTGLSKSGGSLGRPRYPTRYQVYKWEMDHAGEVIDGVTVLARPDSRAAYGRPICSSGAGFGTGTVPSTTVADRRRLSVAVINCQAYNVKGNSKSVPVVEFMDVFLVQPSLKRDRTEKDEIYGEIIGKTTAGSTGETAGTVIRRDVPYLIK